MQATRLAASFELLTGSVAFTRLEKFPRKATCVSVFFSRKSAVLVGHQSVKQCSNNLLLVAGCLEFDKLRFYFSAFKNVFSEVTLQMFFLESPVL